MAGGHGEGLGLCLWTVLEPGLSYAAAATSSLGQGLDSL